MKVGIDVSKMHKLSLTRGIGVYADNLYQSLKQNTDIHVELIEENKSYDNFDLIHFPFFDLFKRTLPLKISKPFVVTIPDLIPLQFPQHYPSGFKGRANLFFQKLALKKAKSVIAISETVKNDISKILNINKQKIFITHLAPSNNFQKINDKKILQQAKNKYNLPEKFVLYIGNVNWNKNILNTAESCIKAQKYLVIVGSSFLDKNNLNHPEKKAHKLFLEKYENNPLIKFLDYVPNEDLEKIMSIATVLIFASYYEGFGLPILEAQSCELPVITSKGSATEEISGDSSILVDAENSDEIAIKINEIFSSENLRKEIIKKGNANVKKFSWKKTAEETIRAYEYALSN